MALTISLRVGDTSTYDINLTDTTAAGTKILDYPLRVPDLDQSTIQNLGDGDGLSIPTWSNVTESIELHIADTTAAAVATRVQAIERLLNLARQGTLGWLDDRLFLRVQFDHDSLVWRSQILSAKLELDQGTDQIWKNFVRATLIITRRYYFETEALQDLQATSGVTTTPTTGYVTIYNDDDTHATNQNWWQIAAAQVGGSIPAPATITLRNDSGGPRGIAVVYIGNYVFCDPANVAPVLAQAGYDAGALQATTTEGTIVAWEIPGGNLIDSFRGQYGRFVVVWNERPAITTLLRAAVMYGSGASPLFDMALGEQILTATNDYVHDLGALPIPPGRAWADMGENIWLVIKGQAASGTDTTISTDWLQIFPSGAGRYRVIKGFVSGLTLSDTNQLVDDGSTGQVYLDDVVNGDHLPLFRPYFDPIYLWPNRINRLRTIISAGSFAFEPGQIWEVKTQYRPRRLSF